MFTYVYCIWSSLIMSKHFFIFLRFPLAISQGSAWARMQPDQSRPLWSPMTAPSWTKSVAMSSMSSNESPDLRASGGRKWVCAGLCQNGGWDGMGLDLHFAGGNCFMSYYTTSCFQYCLTCKLKIGNSKWPDLFHQFSGSPGLGATIQVGQRMSEVRIQIIPWSRRLFSGLLWSTVAGSMARLKTYKGNITDFARRCPEAKSTAQWFTRVTSKLATVDATKYNIGLVAAYELQANIWIELDRFNAPI